MIHDNLPNTLNCEERKEPTKLSSQFGKAKSAQDLRDASAKSSLFGIDPQSQGSSAFMNDLPTIPTLRLMSSDQTLSRRAPKTDGKETASKSSSRPTPKYKLMPTIGAPPTLPLPLPPQGRLARVKTGGIRQNRSGRTLTSNQDTPTPLQRGQRNNEEGQRLYFGSGPVSHFERDLSSLSRQTSQESMSTWPMHDNVPRDPWFTRKDQPLPPLPVDLYTSQPSGLGPEPRRRGNFTLPRRNQTRTRGA
ncbi:hypothetical protein F4809DRAFT_628910 [Biscogniauxia mediterranea]|nr:hypothetical protein F4809DRAFT_628910 [Biscogniauxia mediterranea]